MDVVPFSPKAFRCVVRRTFHRVKSREVGGSTFRQIAVFSLSRSHDFNKEKNIWRFGCIGNRHFEGRPFRVKVRAEKAQPSATYVGNEHDIISQCGIADASHGFGAEPFVVTVMVICLLASGTPDSSMPSGLSGNCQIHVVQPPHCPQRRATLW